MATPAAPRRSLTALFTLLLLLVRLRWVPLESVDHVTATRLNSLIAGNSPVISIVKAVTWLGSGGLLRTLIGAAATVLALRRRWQLTACLLGTGAGALVLDPVLKALAGRTSPVVPHPIAHGIGSSFPSGHALGSIVCYGALLLAFLPAARGIWRGVFTAVIVTMIAAIGISRRGRNHVLVCRHRHLGHRHTLAAGAATCSWFPRSSCRS